ncbi:zf-HC2 domain-containing protein [Paenibacillus spiritus]|uniref:Anti-sigma-W factor RsiW n=1 Tax=Paenibacillus spiritus TaxID=2496557 RepID=A0A5J5GER4_9BACL|nr:MULTISPECIES: zf-HC2 domain-containing protein [Paenibacillus]KAA9006253.1 zf-HC2 domain-containing protein [Paenibacillus spiritus]
MNCREAQERMPLLIDVNPQDPERRQLERHLSDCAGCQAEWALLQEGSFLAQSLQDAVSDERAEAINARVMERIYLENPWLLPGDGKSAGTSVPFRRRLMLWISCFLAVFLSSVLYFVFFQHSAEPSAASSGMMPTGVAGSAGWDLAQPVASSQSGIFEPLVVNMDPTHPEYWMLLSMLGIALSVFSLLRLNRYRRQ